MVEALEKEQTGVLAEDPFSIFEVYEMWKADFLDRNQDNSVARIVLSNAIERLAIMPVSALPQRRPRHAPERDFERYFVKWLRNQGNPAAGPQTDDYAPLLDYGRNLAMRLICDDQQRFLQDDNQKTVLAEYAQQSYKWLRTIEITPYVIRQHAHRFSLSSIDKLAMSENVGQVHNSLSNILLQVSEGKYKNIEGYIKRVDDLYAQLPKSLNLYQSPKRIRSKVVGKVLARAYTIEEAIEEVCSNTHRMQDRSLIDRYTSWISDYRKSLPMIAPRKKLLSGVVVPLAKKRAHLEITVDNDYRLRHANFRSQFQELFSDWLDENKHSEDPELLKEYADKIGMRCEHDGLLDQVPVINETYYLGGLFVYCAASFRWLTESGVTQKQMQETMHRLSLKQVDEIQFAVKRLSVDRRDFARKKEMALDWAYRHPELENITMYKALQSGKWER